MRAAADAEKPETDESEKKRAATRMAALEPAACYGITRTIARPNALPFSAVPATTILRSR